MCVCARVCVYWCICLCKQYIKSSLLFSASRIEIKFSHII